MINKIFIPLIFSSLFFAACCTCSNTSRNSSSDLPEKFQVKADSFIISKTGEDFFHQYVKPDSERITKLKNGYLMVYNFSIPENEGVEGEIRFSIDSLGNIQKDKEIAGIPDCLSKDGCDYKISKDEAAEIAKKSGLEEGIEDWDIRFVWDNEYKNYIWQVRSVISETKGTGRSSGKLMSINAFDGSILATKEWRVN